MIIPYPAVADHLLPCSTSCTAGGRQPGMLQLCGSYRSRGGPGWDWGGSDPIAIAAALKGALAHALHK